MKSIFDLNTKTTDLTSANQGLIQYRYEKFPPQKPISEETGLANGDLTFKWNYGDNVYWIPNRSYISIEYSIYSPDVGTSLTGAEQLTINMNAAACLFKSAQYRVGDQSVSQITQNLPQVDALKSRMTKTRDWINHMGAAINYMQGPFGKREQQLMSLGNQGTQTPYLTIQHIIGEAVDNNNQNAFFGNTLQGDATFTLIMNVVNGACTFTVDNDPSGFAWTDQVTIGDIIELNIGYSQGAVAATRVEQQIIRGTVTLVQAKVVDFIADLSSRHIGQLYDVALNQVEIGPFDINDGSNDNFNPKFYRGDVQGKEDSGRDKKSHLFWIPPLSIFDVQHAMPCAGTKQELILTPYENLVYQRNFIESVCFNRSVNTDYILTIKNVELNLLTCQSNQLPKQLEFMLDFDEIHCQSQRITSRVSNLSWDVIGSCNGITLAFQDGAAGTDSRYSLTKFKIRNNVEQTFSRYYIKYEDQVPKPDFQGFNDYFLSIDTLKHLYLRSKMYDGSFFGPGPESYPEFMTKGLYIYHPFPKTASSRNTSVYTSTSWDVSRADHLIYNIESADLIANALLFQHYKKVVLCKVVNGKIVNCVPIDS